jgi:type I restriction enzyme S subunit
MSGKKLFDLNGDPADATSLRQLPTTWAWSSLEEIIHNFDGKRVPLKSEDRDKRSGPYPYYGASGVIDDIDSFIFDGEYLLIAEDGANLLSRSTSIAFRANGKFWVNNHAHVVQMRGGIPLAYLESYLNGIKLQFFITGTAQPKLNQANLNRIPVPVPPLGEQHRIVAKIEELFSELDAGVAALKRVQANLKRYRSAVLKAAVEGRLTEAWRAEHQPKETGSQLLARILKERRAKWEADQLASFAAAGKTPPKGWQAKYKEPAAPDTSELPSLPKGWCWASMEQVAEIQGGIQKQPKRRPNNNSYPFLRVANVYRDRLDLAEVHRIELFGDELLRLRLQKGDLLIVEGNGSKTEIGRSAVWTGEIEDCVHQNHIIRARFLVGHSHFLNIFWNSPFGVGQVLSQAASTSGLYTLSVRKVSTLPVPIPSIEEQRQIVCDVLEQLETIETADFEIDKQVARADRLRQSILKQAFEGKLVPQDSSDEPASVLLARIRQQRGSPSGTSSSPAAKPRKVSKDVIVRREAIVSYIVNRLASRRSFGRTQLEKTLHLAQSHLGLDLQFAFERYKAGPFDKDIYNIERVAKKRGWFTYDEPAKGKVTYHPGNKIEPMCQSAIRQLADKRAAFDGLLDHIAGMTTDEAELFATAYAAWNDLLIDGRTADDAAIIAEVHGWHEQKKRFTPSQIQSRLAWMRKCGYVPTGQGERTQLATPATTKRRAKSR